MSRWCFITLVVAFCLSKLLHNRCVAILVDGAVVDEFSHGGIACQVPHGSLVHGDIGSVARVVLHDAAVGAVCENQVADGSAG